MKLKQVVNRVLFVTAFVFSMVVAPYASAAENSVSLRNVARSDSRKSAVQQTTKMARVSTRAVQTATNGILTLDYDDTSGLFTINTGANHPNPDETVFFPIGTSYITLRDATSKIMWFNDDFGPSVPGLAGYTLESMLDHPTTTTALPTGFRTVYTLPNFEVTQDVIINGTTLADTNILQLVKVRNTSASERDFGLRYQWDWQIAGNDASLFRPRFPDGTFTSTFATFDNPVFNLFEEVDNVTTPTFSIFGTVANLGLNPPPTKPDQLRYASWSAASGSAWDFANTGSNRDSSVVYYWGFETPITLAPDASKEFAQYVTTQLSAIAQPTVRFSAPSYTVNENGTAATITILREGDVTAAGSVQFATSNGTANAPADYTAVTQTVNFAVGETTKTVSVPVVSDAVSEPNETVGLTLSAPVGASLTAPSTAVLTIVDTTPASLAINDVTVTEGNTGTTNATFTVTLTPATATNVTVNYATANGTATAPSDYTAINGTLTFFPGDVTKTITVKVNGDTAFEPNETFFVNLTASNNADLGDAQGQSTINNDEGPPQLSINNVTVTEGNTGTSNATFTVTLSPASAQTVTVNAIPFNGSARSPGDYTGGGATLTFAPGETSKAFNVPIVGDTLDEIDETFFVVLSSPVNAPIASGQGRGVGTIKDDDGAPLISIEEVSIGEGNVGLRTAVFRLRLSAPSGQLVKLHYSTSDGTAFGGEDYGIVSDKEIAFTTGQTVALARVLINGDLLNEPNETFYVNLSGAIGGIITQKQVRGVILNDDRAPALTIDNPRVTEGNFGTQNLAFTVTLSEPSGQRVTVNYATADGMARANSDYLGVSGTLTFAPGETSKTINVPVLGDTVVEGNETLYMLLSGSTNASIGQGRGIGTILNDDASR